MNKPSRHLLKLVEEYREESFHLERKARRFIEASKTVSTLNSEIFRRCQKEGINIEKLNLNSQKRL